MLQVGFKQVQKKNLYKEGILDSLKSSLYVYKDEFTIAVVKNREEVTLISPQNAKEIKKNRFSSIHLGVIIIGILSQTRAGLDTKAHLYLYDGRFSNHTQAQLATAEVDLRNKVAVVGCLPDIDIDINEFCRKIKLSIQTKGFDMNAEYKNLRIKIFVLGRCYNKYHKKFRFINKSIVEHFHSDYVKMQIPKKLNSSELKGMEWKLPELETQSIEIPEDSTIYILIKIIKLSKSLKITKNKVILK
ncbi:hypothetical protein Ddye_001591 [Dipteronia dyeriana]|uniref:Uncharacterized protein n=1 Tax=Dipteronia dyeriana TaxID=168575 RepID=A0AAD9XPK2_9ROSI|nr:hypothetical protein Ddye_001591 [Dipteronia dyeriana]